MNVADALMSAFDFDESDLEANRSGRLTDRQLRIINPKVFWYFTAKVTPVWITTVRLLHLFVDIVALLELVVVISAAILVISGISDVLSRVAYLLVLLAVGRSVFSVVRRRSRGHFHQCSRQVSTSEGIIKLYFKVQNKPYALKLNRRRFVLSDTQFNALESGKRYRLYFVGRFLLSIEPSNESVQI